MNIGQKIKNDVLTLYKSTTECANVCGVSRNTLIKIYSNGIEGISDNSLALVAQALGYDFAALKDGRIVVDPDLLSRVTSPRISPNNVLEEDILKQVQKLSARGQLKVLEYIEDILPKYSSEV